MVARGLCNAHYLRWKKWGDVKSDLPITKSHPGEPNNNWKGGEVDDGYGRVLIYSPDHPNPTYAGTHVYRYRLVMEEKLGRFLDPKEIVHHINGNNSDDRPENLEVMSQSEHAKKHNVNGRFSSVCRV